MPPPIVLKGFINQNIGSASTRSVSNKQLGFVANTQDNPSIFKGAQGNANFNAFNIDPELASAWPEGTPVIITVAVDPNPPGTGNT